MRASDSFSKLMSQYPAHLPCGSLVDISTVLKAPKALTSETKDHRKRMDLNMEISYGASVPISLHKALNEVTTNQFDEVKKANAVDARFPTVNNLAFVSLRDGDELLIRNATETLAGIVHVRNAGMGRMNFEAESIGADNIAYGTLSFINFGISGLANISNILCFIDSRKVGLPNLIGRHGTGMKQALAALMRHGCGVDIFAAVTFVADPFIGARTYFQHVRVYCGSNGNVWSTSTLLNPVKKWPPHHIEVRITYPHPRFPPNGNFAYAFDSHILCAPLRDEDPGQNDCGDLLCEPERRAMFYAYNVLVMSKSSDTALWGYNLFVRVTMGRDVLGEDEIRDAVARIWDVIYSKQDDKSKILQRLFYEQVIATDSIDVESLIERKATTRLSVNAKRVISDIYAHDHPGMGRPILANEAEYARRWFTVPYDVVTPFFYAILSARYYTTDDYANRCVKVLLAAPPSMSPIALDIAYRLRDYMPIRFVEPAGESVRYCDATKQGVVIVNWTSMKDMDADSICSRLLFHIFPFVSVAKNDTYTVALCRKLFEQPPASVAAAPGNKRIRQEEDDGEAKGKEEDDEEEVPDVVGAVADLAPALLPDAPNGYRYVRFWGLLEK